MLYTPHHFSNNFSKQRENIFLYQLIYTQREDILMNKYQIQVEHKTESKWDWICVFANSDQEAIQNAKIKLYDFQNPIYLHDDDYDAKY